MYLTHRLSKAYKRFLFRLSASESPIFLLYYKWVYRPKPGSVDEFLHQYSLSNRPITFLQVGANDGFIQDPLHKFVKRDNWRGVMLEPQPDVYNNFLVKLHRKRPEIICVNAALDSNDGYRLLYKIAVSRERWATGLSSFYREQLVQRLTNNRFLKHARREGIKFPRNKEEIISADKVATISPTTLLSRYGLHSIKLLAIDTEGFDFEIIKMLDLNRISPEVILYEEMNFDEETAINCRTYLQKHGYTCRTIRKDVVATKGVVIRKTVFKKR